VVEEAVAEAGFEALVERRDAFHLVQRMAVRAAEVALEAVEAVEAENLGNKAEVGGDEELPGAAGGVSEGAPPGGDAEDAPIVSIRSIEDSAAGEPVSGSPQEKAEDSEHARDVTEAPLEVVDVCPETPAEGSVENDARVEGTKSAEPDEGSGSLEAVPSDDVEVKSGEVETLVKERREVALKEDLSLLLAETQSGSVCDEFNFCAKCASRTGKRDHPQQNLLHLVPEDSVKSDYNFNLQDKRVLGVEVVVNDSDNIKQVTEQLVLQAVFPESGMN
jgi:hypothetical protein